MNRKYDDCFTIHTLHPTLPFTEINLVVDDQNIHEPLRRTYKLYPIYVPSLPLNQNISVNVNLTVIEG